MALIKCSECGQMISDKANTCPHCGIPIEQKTICEECGMEISTSITVCSNCGYPIQKTGERFIPLNSEESKKRIQRFLIENRKNFPQNKFEEIRSILSSLNSEQWDNLECVVFKDPTTLLVLSILVGEFGVDRFVLGDITNGALKLLLTLCCGIGLIWWVIDIFKINELTLNFNYRLLKDTLKYV